MSEGTASFGEWLDTVPQPGEAQPGQEQLDLVEPPEPPDPARADIERPDGAIGNDQLEPKAPPKPADALESVVPATHEFTPADDDQPAEAEREARRGPPDESGHSSVKITVNAKGQRQWEVKVYATDGLSPEDAQSRAIAIDQQLERRYGLPGKSA